MTLKGSRVELRDYIRILRKSWVLIVLLTLVAVSAAAVYSIVKTPEYSASTRVFVSSQSADSTTELLQGSSFTQSRVKTYSSLVTTPIVLLPVIASLGLDVTAEELAQRVSASAQLDTTLIEINVTDEDPVVAADIANATSQSLTAVVSKIETTEGSTGSPVKLTRVEDATVSTIPVSPNIPLNIALGALVGLAIGVGLAVLREVLDTRIRNERDMEQLTDTPIMGGIVFDPKAAERPLIVQVDPRSPRAESFRTLRTNLQFLEIDGARSFVVTSSIQGEGKSTTATNLAIAMADAGMRVLLVDADLRRPKVAQYLDLEGAVGLTDVLIGQATLGDTVQRWGRASLYVLPAGQIPPNPSELLGSKAMQQLVVTVEKEFDAVIFDSPPLLPVTDAAILAKRAGGVILVVAAGYTRKNQVVGAFAALQNVDARVSGVVLTMLPVKGPDAYGYGHYGYTYETPDKKTTQRA
ncbi:polysaccharide biosynthesis tyrosine autokinase [Salinibacterium sp. G-O1]|uniref:polysaccharide biosynthesis tyrosine autokinase n=1 Tax=Salinibacterium sp. G-O1 TaxID=3046208 RepID=UPI0024BBD33D|nr:polysaccharide biosynthesis tyrosine autokinase [Salinibacterium sp. G-O1]MDJ0336167.1 polysaccharide biosynthesis tyrosine autokinase [Salinibacterium sp. G-O1]